MGTLCVKICSLDKGERECAKFLIVKRLMCQNILLLDKKQNPHKRVLFLMGNHVSDTLLVTERPCWSCQNHVWLSASAGSRAQPVGLCLALSGQR